jgi:multidrug resistance efflux pump
MEKLIFFILVIPILAYVLYLGGTAIMSGFKSKEANKVEKEETKDEINSSNSDQNVNLSDELNKLNDLKQKGVISEEEFEKAKKKILNS